MPIYSEWLLRNAVFYLQLRLQKPGNDINLLSFEYDTKIRECHVLTITTDYKHDDIPKFQQVNIAFPEKPPHHITIQSYTKKQTNKSPKAIKLIIKNENNIKKLIDFTNIYICEYLNSTHYLNYLSISSYIRPWKVHWSDKEIDNIDPILICEIKPELKPNNDDKQNLDAYMDNFKNIQENIWTLLTHQNPPDISRPFKLSSSGDKLVKGNFPTDNIILQLEDYSLEFLHAEYLALKKRRETRSHKRSKLPSASAKLPAAAITQNVLMVPLAANTSAIHPTSTEPSTIIAEKPAAAHNPLKCTLYYHFSSDEDSYGNLRRESKKSKSEKNITSPGPVNIGASSTGSTPEKKYRKK